MIKLIRKSANPGDDDLMKRIIENVWNNPHKNPTTSWRKLQSLAKISFRQTYGKDVPVSFNSLWRKVTGRKVA